MGQQPEPTNPLARMQTANRLLAEARTIDEVKDVRDKAEAARLYAKQAGLGLEMQNHCAEIKIRAERKAGELLAEMPKQDGGDAARTRLHHATESPPKLEDLGITKVQSHRWQQVASVPEPVFEQHVAKAKEANQELTTAGVMTLAKNVQRQTDQEAVQRVVDLAGDPEGKLAKARLRLAVSKGIAAAHELTRLVPEAASSVMDDGDYRSFESMANDVAQWCEQVRVARTSGLRLIEGGRPRVEKAGL